MSWAARRGWTDRPQTAGEQEFSRQFVEVWFYSLRRDTTEIAQAIGYDESVVARLLNDVRETRYARRLASPSVS